MAVCLEHDVDTVCMLLQVCAAALQQQVFNSMKVMRSFLYFTTDEEHRKKKPLSKNSYHFIQSLN